MREIRQSGSEGGVGQTNASSLTLFEHLVGEFPIGGILGNADF